MFGEDQSGCVSRQHQTVARFLQRMNPQLLACSQHRTDYQRKCKELGWNWSPLYEERWVEAMNGVESPRKNVPAPAESNNIIVMQNGGSKVPGPYLSPRSQRRRRREMELQAKRIGLAGSSSDSSGDETGTSSGDAQNIRKKAQSASPIDESRKRPSYRQYLRQKRSRSRENKSGRQSLDERSTMKHEAAQEDGRSYSQVHWQVHKMPQVAGPVFNEETNPLEWTSPREFWAQDKAQLRKSWLNASQNRNKSAPDHHEPPSTQRPTAGASLELAAAPASQMALLSQSVHTPLHQTVPSSAPKSSALLTKHQALPGRSSEESSPLDIVPVREQCSPPKAFLRISENSAFRPIEPAPPASATRSPGAQLASAHSVSFPSRKRMTVPLASGHSVPPFEGTVQEEPIYVSVNDVTRHQATPAIRRNKELASDPMVQVNPVFDHPVFNLSPQDAFAAAPPLLGSSRHLPSTGMALPLQKSQSVAAVNNKPSEPARRTSRLERFAAKMTGPQSVQNIVPESQARAVQRSMSHAHVPQNQNPKQKLIQQPSLPEQVLLRPAFYHKPVSPPQMQLKQRVAAVSPEQLGPPEQKPFIAKPPPLDESNLERWRARKKSMERRTDLVPDMVQNGAFPSMKMPQSTDAPRPSFRRQVALTQSDSISSPPDSALRPDAKSPVKSATSPRPMQDESLEGSRVKSWIVMPHKLEDTVSSESQVAATWKRRELGDSEIKPVEPIRETHSPAVQGRSLVLQEITDSPAPAVEKPQMGAHQSTTLTLSAPMKPKKLDSEIADDQGNATILSIQDNRSPVPPRREVLEMPKPKSPSPEALKPSIKVAETVKLTLSIQQPRTKSPIESAVAPKLEEQPTAVSPVTTGPNVTSKAHIFEAMAQHEEENKLKGYFPPGFQPQETEQGVNVRTKKPLTAANRAHTVSVVQEREAQPRSPALVEKEDQSDQYRYPASLVNAPDQSQMVMQAKVTDQAGQDKSELSVTQKMKLFETNANKRRFKKRAERHQTLPVTQEEIAAAASFKPPERVKSQNTVVRLAGPIGPKVPEQGHFQLPVYDLKAAAAQQPRQTAKRVVHLHTDQKQSSEQQPAAPVKSLRAPDSSHPTHEPLMLSTESSGVSIAERVAALRKTGEEQWMQKVRQQDDTSTVFLRPKSTPVVSNGTEAEPRKPVSIVQRMSQLTDSTAQWRVRVPQDKAKETESLTVSGKLLKVGLVAIPKARPADVRHSAILPTSTASTTVTIPKKLDEGFDQFFQTALEQEKSPVAVDQDAFDVIAANGTQKKLGVAKNIKAPRRQGNGQSKNPVKALAARTDLVESDYAQKTPKAPGVLMRQTKQMTESTPTRPLPTTDPMLTVGNRSSALADEAIRALQAKEDFGAVKLSKADPTRTPGLSAQYRPYKDLMLIQLRGRKRVDLRLVAPTVESVHSGGCFLLVNPSNLFLFAGKFSNVLEIAKAREVASYILERHDLGCRDATKVIELEEERFITGEPSQHEVDFWKHLGADVPPTLAVPSDVDDRFEDTVSFANTVYQLRDNELILLENFSSLPLRHEVLDSDHVLVFDFGVELYMWSGRNVSGETKQSTLRLAQELFDKAFHCSKDASFELPSPRPAWCLMAHVKERMETSLFRAKFTDWPEVAALRSVKIKLPAVVPQVNGHSSSESSSSSPTPIHIKRKIQILNFKDPSTIEVAPEELAKQLLEKKRKEPNLMLEDQNLGRGNETWNPDDPKMKRYEVTTEKVTMWSVTSDNPMPQELGEKSFGHFNTEHCFIVRWQYRVSFVDVRSVTGGQSKHTNETGRSRAAFFYWIGTESSRSDQGTCALAVRDLDSERNPHVRITQGLEPPAFLNLFHGKMVVHRGGQLPKWRLFSLLGGPLSSESCLVEVDPDPNVSLRAQGAFIITRPAVPSAVIAWLGSECSMALAERARHCAQWISSEAAAAFGFESKPNFSICKQGQESEQWLKDLSLTRASLHFPKPIDFDHSHTVRLFKFTATSSNQFGATEAVSSWFSNQHPLAFPFEQDDLYSATQPSLCMLDQGKRLWLWEGWLDPDTDSATDEAVRQKLRLSRLFACNTAVAYWKEKWGDARPPAYVVYAGLEPEEFKALFPVWNRQDEAAEENRKVGRADGQTTDLFELLTQLSQTEYPASRLRERPLPEGVDGSRIESYLSDSEFLELFSMSKQCYYELPPWKQLRLKKDCQLF